MQQAQAARASTAFAVDLLHAAQATSATPAHASEGNVVVAPASLDTTLAMLLPGARGMTASQISAVLHAPTSPALFAGAVGALDANLARRAARDKITLDLSHAMWVQLGRQVRPDLLRILSAAFDTGVHETDFLHDAKAARAAINTEVARDTHGQIPHLLPEGDVTAETRMVLTDAEYLKASWASPFPHGGTRQAGFQVPGVGEVPTRTLQQQAVLPYANTHGWRAVELPYQGGDLAMDLLTPAAPTPGAPSLSAAEAALDPAALTTVLTALRPREVDLSVPAFTVETDQSLRPALSELGMSQAFDPRAEFSGVLTSPEPIHLSDARQDTRITVDEQGTTAATATAVVAIAGGPAPRQAIPVQFNRPFLFLVRDTQTGQILFLGHITDPNHQATT